MAVMYSNTMSGAWKGRVKQEEKYLLQQMGVIKSRPPSAPAHQNAPWATDHEVKLATDPKRTIAHMLLHVKVHRVFKADNAVPCRSQRRSQKIQRAMSLAGEAPTHRDDAPSAKIPSPYLQLSSAPGIPLQRISEAVTLSLSPIGLAPQGPPRHESAAAPRQFLATFVAQPHLAL